MGPERRGSGTVSPIVLFAGLFLLLGGTALWRLLAGEMPVPFGAVLGILSGDVSGASPQEIAVVRLVRLPRLFAAFGAGASLAVSGVVLQGLLGNPLAEPYTLGVAAGAALGASVGIHLGGVWLPGAAFAGALGALALSISLSRRSGGGSPAHMVLAGIVVSSFLSAAVTLLKSLADEKLSSIVFWLMGGFSGATPEGALCVCVSSAVLLAAALWWARDLDAMSLGERRGTYLGVDERNVRGCLLALASLATALAVSFHGIIGFVGLIGPHLLRMLLGPSHRKLLAASFLGGALLLSVADGTARAMNELPVGVITSFIGGPVFCWILVRERAGRT